MLESVPEKEESFNL